jgi:hypothetical protein
VTSSDGITWDIDPFCRTPIIWSFPSATGLIGKIANGRFIQKDGCRFGSKSLQGEKISSRVAIVIEIDEVALTVKRSPFSASEMLVSKMVGPIITVDNNWRVRGTSVVILGLAVLLDDG